MKFIEDAVFEIVGGWAADPPWYKVWVPKGFVQEGLNREGGRQSHTICNLQSTSVLERTGREERCAKIGLSVKFNEESKECLLPTFGLKKRRQLKYHNIVRCVPLYLQLIKPTKYRAKAKSSEKAHSWDRTDDQSPKKQKKPK